MKSEYIVAKVEDVPEGQHIVIEVGGRQIGLFNVRGRYYALPNACFHQNGPLCRGNVGGTIISNAATDWSPVWAHEGEIIVCPWHTLEFNVTTGQCLAYPHRHLPMYEVRIEGQQIKLII